MSGPDGVDPLDVRPVGGTGLKVTRFGFGGAPMSGFRGPVTEEEAQVTLSAALEAGVTLFDTSPYYGYGRSELRVGQALRDRPRESFVLSTKVGRVMEPFDRHRPPDNLRPGGLPFAPRYDYSAAGAERSLEQSTMRLGIPEIDIVLIHDVDVYTHGSQAAADARYDQVMSGCYPYLETLRSAGTVKAIGVGLNEWEMSLRFAEETDIDCILLAGRYTLLDQGALFQFLPKCVEKNISVILGGPFNSGILATGLTENARYDYGDIPQDVVDRFVSLEKICRRHGVPVRSAALQFPLAHQAVTSVIPGAVSVQEFEENFASMREKIPHDCWVDLKQAGLIADSAPVPGSAQGADQ